MEPEEIEKREFLVSLRGYDRDEVNAFLKEIAEEVRQLNASAAVVTSPQPPPPASDAYKKVGEETSKILVAAEQVAQEIKSNAQREAAEILTDGRHEAASLQRATEEKRRQAEEDMRGLQEARGLLATQLEDVRRRLDETLSRLAATAPPATKPAAPKPKLATPPIATSVTAELRREVREAKVTAPAPVPLAEVLEEVRRDREVGQRQLKEALQGVSATTSEPSKVGIEPLAERSERLKDSPELVARRMKRILQEDQNDLLDRIRTKRGKGTAQDNMPSLDEQAGRFNSGLGEILGKAFSEGRLAAGASEPGDPSKTIVTLIAKQVVNPLRAEITRTVEAGISASDTPTAIAERSSDVFRVWKGVRTELLGEGMTYSAYHHGLMDAWKDQGTAQKRWVVSADERECPHDVCRGNAAVEGVAVGAPFPSGHLVPPAHGGCTCTIDGP